MGIFYHIQSLTVDSLVVEILSIIFTGVEFGVSGNKNVLACLVVNRSCHKIAPSMFYKHIVLDSARLVQFHDGFRLDQSR
jgi:hypothetical protein